MKDEWTGAGAETYSRNNYSHHQGLGKQRTAENDYDEGTSFLLIRPMLLLIVWVFLIRDYYTNSMCSNWWGRLVNPPSLFIVRIQQNTILNYLVLSLSPSLSAIRLTQCPLRFQSMMMIMMMGMVVVVVIAGIIKRLDQMMHQSYGRVSICKVDKDRDHRWPKPRSFSTPRRINV